MRPWNSRGTQRTEDCLMMLPGATQLGQGFRPGANAVLDDLLGVNVGLPEASLGSGEGVAGSRACWRVIVAQVVRYQQIRGTPRYDQCPSEPAPIIHPRNPWVFFAGAMWPGIRNFRGNIAPVQHAPRRTLMPASLIAGIFGSPGQSQNPHFSEHLICPTPCGCRKW